jgi:hypothetical protein
MGKLTILLTLNLLFLILKSKVHKHKGLAFHIFLSDNVKKSIKHSVHGNKFVWFPEIKLSASHKSLKIKRQEMMDYESLSHIFKKQKLLQRKPMKIKKRRLESVMVREQHLIKGKLHTDETNLHNLKCQCVFREMPASKPALAQKQIKPVKSHKMHHLKKRLKKRKKQKRRQQKKSKPSLKSCLLSNSISRKKEILCDYFYSDILSQLTRKKSKKHKHRKHGNNRLIKELVNKKRLKQIRKMLNQSKNRRKKRKNSNLVLLELNN